jgi:predicted DNA-binding protein with PD1-like motif
VLNTRVSAVMAKTGHGVLARILRCTDLVIGIFEICKQNGITAGAILIAIGSLRKAEISWAIPT